MAFEYPLNRYSSAELDKAIEDAIKRGHELVYRTDIVQSDFSHDLRRAARLAANLGCKPVLKQEVRANLKFSARMRIPDKQN